MTVGLDANTSVETPLIVPADFSAVAPFPRGPESRRSKVRFSVLGLLSIAMGDGVVRLQPARPTNLLAALLLRPNEVVSISYLSEAIWPDEPPQSARATVQTYVMRLRKIFQSHGIDPKLLETTSSGYRVTCDASSLDLLDFRQHCVRAARCENEDVEQGLLTAALEMWSLPILENIDSPFLHDRRVPALVDEWFSAQERLNDLHLAREKYSSVMQAARGAVAVFPDHERFWEQLIDALHRSGRRSQAFLELGRIKAHLREELGIDPGVGLRELELTLLRSDPVSVTTPAQLVESTRRVNTSVLPPDLPFFVGRDQDACDLAAQLTAERTGPLTATISGLPGTGKTALAVHVLHQVKDDFGDSRWVVAARAPDGTPRPVKEVAQQVLDLMRGVAPSANSIVWSPKFGFRNDGTHVRVVVVVDDIATCADARSLLLGIPGSAVVFTRSASLAGFASSNGGWHRRLRPLDGDESQQLVGAAVGARRLAADPEGTARLIAVCEGSPLALRAAVRHLLEHPAWSIGVVATRFSEAVQDAFEAEGEPSNALPVRLARIWDQLSSDARDLYSSLDWLGDVRLCDIAASAARSPGAASLLLRDLDDACLIEEVMPGVYRSSRLVHTLLTDRSRTPADSTLTAAG